MLDAKLVVISLFFKYMFQSLGAVFVVTIQINDTMKR